MGIAPIPVFTRLFRYALLKLKPIPEARKNFSLEKDPFREEHMDRNKPDRGLDLEEILNPKSKLSTLSTFMHILWLRKWRIIGIWLLLAIPSAVFLAFYDLPQTYSAVTYVRFPRVTGNPQSTMVRDMSLGEAESVVRLFMSQRVVLKTIDDLGLRFQLKTKNVYREQILDSLGYTKDTPVGRYKMQFKGDGRIRVLHKPWGMRSYNLLFDGKAGNDGSVYFAGATIRFKPALLGDLRGVNLDWVFLSQDEAMEDFGKRLKVEPLDKGQVAVNYSVELQDKDPFLVAPVLNELTRNFIAVYSGTTQGQDQGVIAKMEKSLEAAKLNLKTAQDRVSDFYRRNQSRMTAREGNPIALTAAQTKKAAVEGYLERLDQSIQGMPNATSFDEDKRLWISEVLALLSGQGVQRAEALRGRVTDLERKRVELAAKYNPTHPFIVQVDSDIAALFEPVSKLAIDTRRLYQDRLAQANGEMARNQPGAVADMSVEMEAKRLTDERDNASHNVDNLQAELDKAKLGAGPDLFKVDIIDPARPPLYEPPSLATRLIFSAAAVVVTFFPGFFWALIAQILFPRIWNKDDVERKLKVKVLGSLFHMHHGPMRGELPQGGGTPLDPCLLHFGRVAGQADVEAYRSLRTELETHFADPGGAEHLCILITSTQPNEGKSLVSANLAVGFARRGKRTLLVDVDFRHGRIERMFGYRPQEGLADVLRSAAPGDFMAQAQSRLLPTPQPNLSLMPKGTFDEAATEAAWRQPMEMFIQAARASFDVVILDGPPAIVTSDPLILARLAGNVLFVIRSGQISAHEAGRALDPLRDRDIRLAAAVNGIRQSPADENYYAKYGYYYLMPGAPMQTDARSPRLSPS
jgi:capsular exopolysaccharide synthesis family protein